ncbi:MAG: helicase C-terminal domain-containing protein [Candidatus Magnetobacterium sp. LHC-1]|nr:DEAD/DEAH box helicase [Nitrospirota bacterium]
MREHLGQTLAGYEYRPQQEAMANAVMAALQDKTNLLVEAGTGVGKSLAYLIATILWIKQDDTRKVVVSTYTKALQRQLYDRDLPFLKEKLFPDITYALCLGSENYLCLRRLYQTRQFGLFDVGESKAFADLLRWASVAVKGIRSEIEVDSNLWGKVDRESDLCYGKSCKTYRECFYQKAKVIERKSNILVVNHHLFFANVSAGSKVLPKFDAVIFDEAHELEDVAASYLGHDVSNTRINHLLDTVLSINGKGLLTRLKDIDKLLYNDIISAMQAVRNGSDQFFLAIADLFVKDNTLRIRQHYCVQDTASEPLATLQDLLNDLAEASREDESYNEVLALVGRCAELRHSIELFLTQGVEDAVYHAERAKTRIKAVVTPVNIAQRLRDSVFSTIDTSILTSATLSLNGDFSYIKDRLSPCPCNELLLDSPFDYRKQALLYVPADMPNPRDEGFTDAAIKSVTEILDITRGQTMVLFTSYRLLNQVADAIDLDLAILRQGEMDNYRLIETFKNTDNAVLFGTYTFWQGIDFPGNELRCVVIAKLPFAVPTEPVLEGRREYIIKCGGDPFYDYQVPRAILTLRQGFGRLIRTKTDSGVVAILDSRLRTQTYGRMFLESLPNAKLAAKIEDVRKFYHATKK